MSEKSLHALIGLALCGTLVFFALDVFRKDYMPKSFGQKKIPSVAPTPIDPLSECMGPYVNIKNGAQWRYAVTSTSPEKTSSVVNLTLESKVLGKMTFLVSNVTTKKEARTELICKNSGIYGLPLVVVPQAENILQQIQFIPNRRTYKNRSWTSTLNVGALLPIKTDSFPLSLNFTVLGAEKKQLGGSTYDTITIKSTTSSNNSIDLSSFLNVEYKLGENIGLTEGMIKVKMPGQETYDYTIALQSFSNPL